MASKIREIVVRRVFSWPMDRHKVGYFTNDVSLLPEKYQVFWSYERAAQAVDKVTSDPEFTGKVTTYNYNPTIGETILECFLWGTITVAVGRGTYFCYTEAKERMGKIDSGLNRETK